MALPKLFQRIFWHNNTTPAINEDNLNAMSKAIDDIDNRVIALGDNVMTVVPQIQAYLEQAEDLVEAMELLSENPPYIGQNGNWWVWDTNTSAFVDSGVDASISVDIADITMLAPNAEPYVTNSGTDTDPIFHLFIPRGQTGNGISTIAKTGTSGLVDTYTITMTDGTTSTFTVTNGAGDMNKSVYDPTNAIANAGGMKSAAAKDSTNAVTANSTDLVESGAVYAKTEPLLANILRNGAVNKLPLDLATLKGLNTGGTWTDNVYSYLGLTVTVNNDGTITIGAGTTTAFFDFFFAKNALGLFKKGVTYRLTSLGYSTQGTKLFLRIYVHYNGTWNTLTTLTDDGTISFTIPDNADNLQLQLSISSGKSITAFSVYPMITDEDILPTKNIPYAMTNRELTEEINKKLGVVKEDTSSWNHTANITCNLNSAGLAYLFTNVGLVLLTTTSGSISMRTGLALSTETNTYFKASINGLSAEITVWQEATFETSKNALWTLVPINGNWTMTSF